MKKIIKLILILCYPMLTIGQSQPPDIINGDWQGILKQTEGPFTTNYAYWITFRLKGDSVVGIARTEAANTPYYAVINIKGTINNNRISFVQDRIIKSNTRENSKWCLIKGTLIYNPADTSISGNWTSDTDDCQPGSLLLYKSKKRINEDASIKTAYAKFEQIETKLKNNESIVGFKIILSKIPFETNSYKIQETGIIEINKIYKLLDEYEIIKINIQGHTDNVGKDDDNMRLSYLRAKAINDLLIEKGIDKSRITYEGYGKSRPIATNETEVGRQKNRRVEIEFTLR